MKNLITSTVIRGIPTASLEAATKNPVITIIDSTTTGTAQNNKSLLKARNVFEFALVHDILRRDPLWLEKIKIFRSLSSLRLGASTASSSKKNRIIDIEQFDQDKNTNIQLQNNWWLQCAPFIHPSYWDNLAERTLEEQQELLSSSNSSSSSAAAAEEILVTLQQNLPLLKNQFSMIPLQNQGDAVISLALSTLDFTILPQVASSQRNISKSQSELEKENFKKNQKAYRSQIKKGLQDAEFISKNIVCQKRRKVLVQQPVIVEEKGPDGKMITTKKNQEVKITIPSWCDDLLLLKDKQQTSTTTRSKSSSSKTVSTFDLLSRPPTAMDNTSEEEDGEDEEYNMNREEASVGSFIAMIGSVSIEHGVERASQVMWRLAEDAVSRREN